MSCSKKPKRHKKCQASKRGQASTLAEQPRSLRVISYKLQGRKMNELKNALEISEILKGLTASSVFSENPENVPIKNAVLITHNRIEGFINLLVSRYFFSEEAERKETDKVNYFWINILGNMNFMRKVGILEELSILRDDTIEKIKKINYLRNDLAHFPHRQHKRKAKHLTYGDKHIFENIDALREFSNDYELILREVSEIIKKSQKEDSDFFVI